MKKSIVILLVFLVGVLYAQRPAGGEYVKKSDFGKNWCQNAIDPWGNQGWWCYIHNPSGGTISVESFNKMFEKSVGDSALIPIDTMYSDLSKCFRIWKEKKTTKPSKII